MIATRQAGMTQGIILVAQAVLPTMGSAMLVPVLPLLFREYGAMANAQYWIPALVTVPGLCIALLSPLFGWIADRTGRRPLLIAALLFYGFAGIAPIFLTSFAAVFASRVVLGICDAAVIVVSATLVGDYYTGATRAKWLAMISTVASLSAAVFFALSGVLGETFGWRGAVSIYAASLLFLPAMLFFTWEPEAATAADIVEEAPADRSLARHIWLTSACTLFGATLFYILVLQQGLGLAALGTLEPGRIGLLIGVASLGNPIATLVFRRLTRLPTTILLSLAFGIIAAGLIAMGGAGSDLAYAAAAFVGLFGAGLLMPTLLTWTMNALPFAARGRGTSVFQSMFAFGQFGSTVSLPFLTAHVTGNVLWTFALLGLFSLAAALLAGGLRLSRADRPVLHADPRMNTPRQIANFLLHAHAIGRHSKRISRVEDCTGKRIGP